MSKILVAGLDGSKANFGMARMALDLDTLELTVDDLLLIKTEITKVKNIRTSSDDLRRAREVYQGLVPFLKDCVVAFGEVPYGGKSADACRGFGITTGIYACLPVPMIEVTQGEVKKAAVGTRTASKQEMIEWASERWPNAPWLRERDKPDGRLINDNEHLADACAIAYCGVGLQSFKQLIAIHRAAIAA